MKVEIRHVRSDKVLFQYNDLPEGSTIKDVKKRIASEKRGPEINRQSLRPNPRGKSLDNDRRLEELTPEISKSLCLYLRDLGPQIGWRTVFLTEYSGPLIIYFSMWLLRQPLLNFPYLQPITTHRDLRNLAMVCYCGHYVKRLLETVFVHRFSHATMPLRNLFKNCSYYFGFTLFVSYFINHPLYTLPTFGCQQICLGLGIFLVAELGNLWCHLTLRDLRPPGSTVRRIPEPVPYRPLTRLFNWVACPHYSYEALAWFGFSVMTQSLPALLFTMAGFVQMAIWARGKLHAYRREFPNYPRSRKAIVPLLF